MAFKTLRHLLSILLLPGVVTLLIPGLILGSARLNVGGNWPAPWNFISAAAGLFFAVVGLVLLVSTVVLFARLGQGTLAPWDPPQKLVIRGPYRYVRNPMISGVLFLLLGEALCFGSLALLVWFGAATLLNLVYIPLSEEPGLARRFGEEYREYWRRVPRWIPRLKPWRG